jgi:hypothetical protein
LLKVEKLSFYRFLLSFLGYLDFSEILFAVDASSSLKVLYACSEVLKDPIPS